MVCTIRPIRSVDYLRNNLNALFNSVTDYSVRYNYPLVNAYESSDAVTVVAQVPGVTKENLSIHLENGVLKLSGKKQVKNVSDTTEVLHRERSESEFEKTIRIPVKIDESSITASLKDGILTVVLPKSEEVKPRTISIQ